MNAMRDLAAFQPKPGNPIIPAIRVLAAPIYSPW